MDKKTFADRLIALAKDDDVRSKTAIVNDFIDEIERAMNAGVPRKKIIEELAACGLEITLKSFDGILYRIRKRRGKPTAKPSHSEPNKAKESAVQESKKNDEPEPEAENDYDEFSVLSAREKRERRIAEFINEPPTNPLLHLLKDHKK
jgi:hypothetical protein